jgi:conjugative transposon TraN protein
MIKYFLTVAAFIVLHAAAIAQADSVSFIPSYHLDITTGKTTNLVFPYAVISVDRGNRDILAQKVKGAENVLELKAGRDSFPETNVTVITADGRLFSFIADYAKEPGQLNFSFVNSRGSGIAHVSQNHRVLKETADFVEGVQKKLFSLRDSHDRMHVLLKGLYLQNDVFYFQLQFTNQSNVGYDVDAIRFVVKDVKKPRRTAIQETELQPLYSTGLGQGINAGAKAVIVAALPKFTLPDGKYLSINVMEKNGGRELNLKVGNHVLVRAKNLGL